ncbi:hypothetical protein BH11PSE8_BH11PSE8_42640 [soil metagenome]
MPILVVQIPQRSRLRARRLGGAELASPAPGSAEYAYVLSADGLGVQSEGQSPAALLPRATSVVAVLSDADVSWHRITLPKAPAARLRAALDGVLEEALLEDTSDVHLALAPQAVAGKPTWVAAVDLAWLRGQLALLEQAQIFVDRVVPMAWPDDPPSGYFSETTIIGDGSSADGVALNWAHADGVACIRLQGGLARTLVPSPAPEGTKWSATPGAAAAAEQWLGAPVSVMLPSQRLLQSARSLWNLRQFDLARRTRGRRAVAHSLGQFFSREWRAVRYGVIALVVVQIIGLNLWAWHQGGAVEAKRAAVQSLVKATYPKVSELDIQRDANAVMQREAQALRTLAGVPGDTDLEPMLQAAASAWPTDRPPVDNLRFEPGKLTLAAPGWSDVQIEQFRSVLRPGGWQVDSADGRVVISRARAGSGSAS